MKVNIIFIFFFLPALSAIQLDFIFIVKLNTFSSNLTS